MITALQMGAGLVLTAAVLTVLTILAAFELGRLATRDVVGRCRRRGSVPAGWHPRPPRPGGGPESNGSVRRAARADARHGVCDCSG